MPRARCALAMTPFFARSAVQSRAGRPGGRPLRMRNKRRGKTGRCGERTERCRWQRKRSERVAAVKILSVRRKAAQKFWAPQQDHRPLQKVIDGAVCGGTHGSRPTGRFCRAGPACPAGGAGKTRSGRCRHRPLRKRNKRCNGRATARVAPTKALQEVRGKRADVGIGPYEGDGMC